MIIVACKVGDNGIESVCHDLLSHLDEELTLCKSCIAEWMSQIFECLFV